MLGGVIRYAAYCLANGTEPQFVKQPTTFFGPSEHYLSDWNIPAARASPAYKNIHDQRAETYAILTGKTKNERPNTDERVITGEAVRIA